MALSEFQQVVYRRRKKDKALVGIVMTQPVEGAPNHHYLAYVLNKGQDGLGQQVTFNPVVAPYHSHLLPETKQLQSVTLWSSDVTMMQRMFAARFGKHPQIVRGWTAAASVLKNERAECGKAFATAGATDVNAV